MKLHCGNQLEAKEDGTEGGTNLQGRGIPWNALKVEEDNKKTKDVYLGK